MSVFATLNAKFDSAIFQQENVVILVSKDFKFDPVTLDLSNGEIGKVLTSRSGKFKAVFFDREVMFTEKNCEKIRSHCMSSEVSSSQTPNMHMWAIPIGDKARAFSTLTKPKIIVHEGHYHVFTSPNVGSMEVHRF